MDNNSINTVNKEEFLIEKLNESLSWMGPQNTVGDFLTVFLENLLDDIVGEDLLAISFEDMESKEIRNNFVTKLKENDVLGIWGELQLEQ